MLEELDDHFSRLNNQQKEQRECQSAVLELLAQPPFHHPRRGSVGTLFLEVVQFPPELLRLSGPRKESDSHNGSTQTSTSS